MTNLDDEFSFRFTGFSLDELSFILQELKSLKNSPGRSKCQALTVYLFWLKTSLDQNSIAYIFGSIDRNKVKNYCKQVREALTLDFVHHFLGANSKSREEWLDQNSEMSKLLFDMSEDQLGVIADGTYLYTEKSKNNNLQREMYSGQKKCHLIKPFVMCTTNGYIINIYGPYPATSNDSKIINHIMDTEDDIKQLIRPNDGL